MKLGGAHGPRLRLLELGAVLLCSVGCARVNPPSTATERETPAATASAARQIATATAPESGIDFSARSQLDFRGGGPVLPIRLMEGQKEVSFSSPGRMRIHLVGPISKVVDAAPGPRWTVRVQGGEPGTSSIRIILGEVSYSDKAGLQAEQLAWAQRGFTVRVRSIGTVYGIRGHVIDNRRYLVMLDEDVPREQMEERRRSLERRFGIQTSVLEDLEQPPTGSLELLDPSGAVAGISKDRLTAEPLDQNPIAVRRVEYGIGYDFHGFEDRTYRGSLELNIDRRGELAVVNIVSLEDLLKGLVPAEIFARAPMEALKAQAVTARGEILAKIGTKHIGQPYFLCSEQHCAVYKGLSGEADSSSAAVDATRGEALFSIEHRLVDSVYSAVCGGHTEDNDAVWGGPPSPHLRGKPDLLSDEPISPVQGLANFLSSNAPAACRLASLAQPGKYRWERRFTREELDRMMAPLGLGGLQAISVRLRGVSGRARTIELSGSHQTVQVRGELNIRRLFGMLNSSMFVIEVERLPGGEIQSVTFRGGGWGHGVGMCQLGAIGRAERGDDYRTILRHYFAGAEVFRLY